MTWTLYLSDILKALLSNCDVILFSLCPGKWEKVVSGICQTFVIEQHTANTDNIEQQMYKFWNQKKKARFESYCFLLVIDTFCLGFLNCKMGLMINVRINLYNTWKAPNIK